MARILSCCGCGAGWQLQIGPLAWEPPYAAGAALEKAKRQKKKKEDVVYTQNDLAIKKNKILSFAASGWT